MGGTSAQSVGSGRARREFDGKVVLVTGASSGIGRVIALAFVREGARVALLARREDRLAEAAREMETAGGTGVALPLRCDVTMESMVIAAFERTVQHFGGLDIVVSNAGGTPPTARVEDTTLEQWNSMFEAHSTGYFLVAREAVRTFKRQARGGVIVFVSSDNAIKPSKELAAYNAAKAAELHLARCIADECGEYGIRINSVLPGAVFGRSEFWTPEFRRARAARHGYDPMALEEEYKKKASLGVIILPEDVAEAVLFLAGDRSSRMTGTMLSIDGGGSTGYVR